MRLLTDEQIKNLTPISATAKIDTKAKIVKIKFFTSDIRWSWYVVDYDKDENIFFVYDNGYYLEWSYFYFLGYLNRFQSLLLCLILLL